jgi:hypothetical protein
MQLAEFSKEHRRIVCYNEIPPIVRDAILAAEDKNFFSHGAHQIYESDTGYFLTTVPVDVDGKPQPKLK